MNYDAYAGLPQMALSIRQPWAFAVAHGWKPVENRSWKRGNPGLHFRGPFAIHASSGMTRAEYEDAAEVFEDCGFQCPPAAELLRGGIVGVATITDIVTDHPSCWFFGPKGLVIAEPRPVDFIPVGGQLGFFDWRKLLPFAKNGRPIVPAKWMLPAEPKPATQSVPKRSTLPDEKQGRLL